MKLLWKTAILILLAALVCGLSACGCDDGGDVVYVQTDGIQVTSVVVEGHLGGGGAQNADGSPLKAGNSLSFRSRDTGWPMTVNACREADGAAPIASLVIPEAPAEGERWFVYFRNGVLTYGPDWPEEG